jgi:hypothetical protein
MAMVMGVKVSDLRLTSSKRGFDLSDSFLYRDCESRINAPLLKFLIGP